MTEYNQEGVAIAPVVVRWVEALRSGRYTQAQKYLHVGTGFCCLGVACDLDGDAGWEHTEDTSDIYEASGEVGPKAGLPIYSTADGSTGLPGTEVLEWLELSLEAAESLAHLNDTGKDFLQIADEIERMYAEGDNYVEPVSEGEWA